MKFKTLLIASAFAFTSMLNAQEAEKLDIKYSGYVDAYAAVENDNTPQANNEVDFSRGLTYINPKKNQLGLNIALLNVNATYKNMRASFGIQHGDLVNTAFIEGATNAPFIQQANFGVNLFDNFWFDAGYFLTHVGGEALMPKDNWLSSHSLVTYYEPFYQAGLRFSYETDAFTAQLHILNGNGIIEENNHNKTIGLFASYKVLDNFTVSYANVMGNEEAGSPNNGKTHFLHNVCAQYDFSEDFSIKAQADIATKEKIMINNEEKDGSYLGISAQAKYSFTKCFSAAFRFAMINNKTAFIQTH